VDETRLLRMILVRLDWGWIHLALCLPFLP
jgi:hypothetical protein